MLPDALSLLDSAGEVRPLGEIEGELIHYAVPITAGGCRRSPAGCKSAVQPSTGSWKRWDCTAEAPTLVPEALQESDSGGKSPKATPRRRPVPGTNGNQSRRLSATLGFGLL